MARREVHIHGHVPASADVVWGIARNFCGLWHPAIDTIIAERNGAVRRFTVKGEDTIYRERLNYFSDSDRTYSYSHIEGISGIAGYVASISISTNDDSTCHINWRATIYADETRAAEVAEGTGAIFQMGLDALCRLVPLNVILHDEPSLALTVAGPHSKTLCLFLHGIGGGRRNWARQLPIAAQYMKSAALDLRGYGDSQLGPSPSTVDDYCDDILRVMHQLNAEQVVLCGLSYGSWIATSFAMRHGDKLAGIVLAGGCTGMSEASIEERETFRATREGPLNEGKSPKDFAPAVINVIASANAPENIRQELHDSMAAISSATYRDALQCFTQPTEIFDFSKLTMPVLLMTGEFDRLAKPAEIRAVAARVHSNSQNANVRFEIISGAGHVCNVEQPAVFNALLSAFLKNIPLGKHDVV